MNRKSCKNRSNSKRWTWGKKSKRSRGNCARKSQKGGVRKKRSHKHGSRRHSHKHSHKGDARKKHRHKHTRKQKKSLRKSRKSRRSKKPYKYSTPAVMSKKRKKTTGLSSKARGYPYRHQHPTVTNKQCSTVPLDMCGTDAAIGKHMGEQCKVSVTKSGPNKGAKKCVRKSQRELKKIKHTHGLNWGRKVQTKSKKSRKCLK